MRLPSGALAVAALLAGCATLPSAAPPAATEPPATWTAAPSEGAEPEAKSSDDRWWESFDQPELGEVIGRALEENRDLATAAARVEEAAALARIAGADLGPQAGLALDAARARRNFIGFPIPGGGDVLSTTSTSLGVSLNLSWEADLWGRLSAREAAATARLQAAVADAAAARLSVAGQTAKAWFAVVEASRQVALARSTLDSRQRSERQVRRRYVAGLRPGIDLRLASVNSALAEAALASRERRLDLARRQLELLLSTYPAGRPAGTAEAIDLPRPPPPPPAGLPADLIERRPDLAAQRLRWRAAGFAVNEARAARLPALRLTGSAGRVSKEVEDLLDSDFSVWSLAAGLLQPVFQSGRLAAGVDLSEARQQALAQSYAQATLRAFAEVELALGAESWLAEQRTALARAAEQSLAAEQLAQERYASGVGNYLAVLEAQREASAAQSRLLDVDRQILDARVDLYLALGGGWSLGADTPNLPPTQAGASPPVEASRTTP